MTISSFFIVIPAAFIVALLGMLIVHRSHQKTQVQRQLRKQLLHGIETQSLP